MFGFGFDVGPHSPALASISTMAWSAYLAPMEPAKRLCWSGTTDLPGTFTADSAARNYVGCAGLGMLAASVVPPLYAWIFPTGFTFAAIAFGVSNVNTTSNSKASTWAWVLQSDQHHQAFVISLALAVVGLAAFAASSGQLSIRLPRLQLTPLRSKGELS
jgi:hypothetical protein